MKNHRRYLLIPVIALVHLVVSGAVLLAGAGASLGRLETGARDADWPEQVAGAAGEALLYPLFVPANSVLGRTPGPVSWMLLVANSVVWAVAIYLLVRLAMRRRAQRVRDAATPRDGRILRT